MDPCSTLHLGLISLLRPHRSFTCLSFEKSPRCETENDTRRIINRRNIFVTITHTHIRFHFKLSSIFRLGYCIHLQVHVYQVQSVAISALFLHVGSRGTQCISDPRWYHSCLLLPTNVSDHDAFQLVHLGLSLRHTVRALDV